MPAPPRRTVLTGVAVVSMIAPFAGTGIPVSAAGPAGGVGVAPGHVDPSRPETRSYFEPVVAPGATFTDYVVVTNGNDHAVTVDSYAADGETAVASGAVYLTRDNPDRATAAWITTAVARTTIPAGSQIHVGFTVAVPRDALPGDHLAGVVTEIEGNPDSDPGVSVRTVVRGIVGVLVQVPGPAAFQLTITAATIAPTAATGTASVVATVGNAGRRLGKPRLSITLDGPDGYHRTVPGTGGCNPARNYCGQLDTVLPGDVIDFPFPWPASLAPGDYTIELTGESSESPDVVHYTAHYHLGSALAATIPNSGARPAAPPAAVTPARGWIAWFIAGVLATLLALAMVYFVAVAPALRRRRDSGVESDPAKRAAVRRRLREL